MDDLPPEDWAIGLLVLIAGSSVVAIGAAWYPDLKPGTWAQWVGGFVTFLAVLVALFGDWIRGLIFGPKLDVAVSTEPPDCVRVEAFNQINPGTPVDTVYVRIRVFNDGQLLAREVQVFAESVQFGSGQEWQPVRMFPSMNLAWSDLPLNADVRLRMFFPGLGPSMSKHCDLGRIAFPGHRHLIGDGKQGLNVSRTAFAFETVVKPNHQGQIVGPGRYRIRLRLAARTMLALW